MFILIIQILLVLIISTFLIILYAIDKSKSKHKDTLIYIVGGILVLTLIPIMGSVFENMLPHLPNNT